MYLKQQHTLDCNIRHNLVPGLFLVRQTKSLDLFVREKEMVVINLFKIIPQQETLLTYETNEC